LSAAQKIKASWQSHPEAMLPLFAGMLMENCQPIAEPKSPRLLAAQADLFQLAADSPSLMPTVPRLARYLAAKAQYQLFKTDSANSTSARQVCLANTREGSQDAAAAECRVYFDFAFELGDLDLSRSL